MAYVHGGADATGTKCSGHAQQGTVNLSRAMQDVFGGTSDGIYACRPVRGGSRLSEHGEGRAYDHHWTDAHAGFAICNILIDHNDELGIEQVIWFRKIWSAQRPYWHDYDGQDPHTGHIHVGQNWSGARWLQYADAVRILRGSQVVPASHGSVVVLEEDTPMLPKVVHWNGAIFLVGYDEVKGQPWRRTFPNPSRLAQVVGGGGCVTDHGNAFEVTNPQFELVYEDRGPA